MRGNRVGGESTEHVPAVSRGRLRGDPPEGGTDLRGCTSQLGNHRLGVCRKDWEEIISEAAIRSRRKKTDQRIECGK